MRFNSSSLSVFSPSLKLKISTGAWEKKVFWFGRSELSSLSFSLSLDSYSFSTNVNASICPIGESFLEKWQFSLEKTSFVLKWYEFQTWEDDAFLSVKRKDLAIWSDGITIMSYHMRRISAASATHCNLQRYLRIMKREEY